MPGSPCLGLPIHPPPWAKSRPAKLHTLEDPAAEACGHELACEGCPSFRPSPTLSTPLHVLSLVSPTFLELRAEHKGWLYTGLKRGNKGGGPRWCMQPQTWSSSCIPGSSWLCSGAVTPDLPS